MLNFISENLILCITMLYVIMTLVISIKLRKTDIRNIYKYGKSFMEMPLRARNKVLLKGKWIKLMYILMSVLFAIVLFCRLYKLINIFAAAVLSVVLAVLTAFVFFEFILVISALLRKVIAVNSAVLNVMFSSVILILSMLFINFLTNSANGISVFILSQLCLVCCYIMMLFALIMVLREAHDDSSRLTLKNIWKSAFLIIILFIFDLSLMSGYCYLYNTSSFGGVENGLFDLIYYTVVTFATVGYGDIVPNTVLAKSVSILTVFTSILCITVLLSGIAGAKKKNNK